MSGGCLGGCCESSRWVGGAEFLVGGWVTVQTGVGKLALLCEWVGVLTGAVICLVGRFDEKWELPNKEKRTNEY